MKPVSTIALSGADTVSVNGPAILADQLISASFQASFADTAAAGTIQIQASNDVILSASPPTHWSNITGATSTVTAGVAPIIFISNMCYKWVRVSFTSTTPGTSTMAVAMFAFGV